MRKRFIKTNFIPNSDYNTVRNIYRHYQKTGTDHEVWTLDTKEDIQLADQTYASWSWLVMAEKLLKSALFGYPTSD